MGIFKEFREFAIRGNMIDMAVGIIIGTAFNGVVDVLVKQVVMPPLSLLTEGVKFSNRKWVLREGVEAVDGTILVEEVNVAYGALMEVFLDFLIIGFTVFMVIKLMNRFRKKAEDPKDTTVAPAKEVELLENMKRLLEEQNELLRNK